MGRQRSGRLVPDPRAPALRRGLIARASILILLASCGRIGFDAPSVDAITGHDEDGDGLVDAIDPCPCTAGTDRDTDGDGVGDDCDISNATDDDILLFSTMQATAPFVSTGAWTQLDDSLHFDGTAIDAQLDLDIDARDTRIDVGFEIHAVLGTNVQHQLSLAASTDINAPHLFVELNEVPSFSNAAVTLFDGANYMVANGQALPSGMHAGRGRLQLTQIANTSVTMDGGWVGEPYHIEEPTTLYTNATYVALNVNNLDIDIRYVCIIATH